MVKTCVYIVARRPIAEDLDVCEMRRPLFESGEVDGVSLWREVLDHSGSFILRPRLDLHIKGWTPGHQPWT